eukprot:2133876-Amphidinium_carterae.2
MDFQLYFNSTYTGTDEDNRGQVGGDNNDPVTIAFMKGKARGQKKAKDKERKETMAKEKTERQ